MKDVTIRSAMKFVGDHPDPDTEEYIQLPVWELITRTLFDIANSPNPKVRGSYGKANQARKLILDRLVGKRKPGSHPATRGNVDIEFVDLTGGEISGPQEPSEEE